MLGNRLSCKRRGPAPTRNLTAARERSSAEAAVYSEAGAGDETGFRAGEVGDKGGYLATLAVTRQRQKAFHQLGEWPVRRVQIRINRAGLDVVDGDAARAEVASQTAREAGDGGFRHGVDAGAREWHAVGVDAADGDDAPAFAHVARRLLRGDEDAADV